MYNEILTALQQVPLFRERRNRAHYLMIMALRASGAMEKDRKLATGDKVIIEIGSIQHPGAFMKLGPVYESYSREWRNVMRDHPELHGIDFEDKTALEQEKQLELGYEPKEYSEKEIDRLMKEEM